MERELTGLREIIGDCDKEIVQALKTRMECIEGIIQYKRNHGLPVLQPEQEKKQLDRICKEVEGTPFGEEIIHIFERIMENSRKIQAKAIEMDRFIEEKEGMKISQIFDVHGEEYFRNCESNTLIELRSKNHAVISCGGGVPLRPHNVELMKKNGYVIWLTAKPEAILERVKDSTERPLLNGHMNVSYISSLMESRREKYSAAADLIIDTTGKEIVEICEELLQKLSAMQKNKKEDE